VTNVSSALTPFIIAHYTFNRTCVKVNYTFCGKQILFESIQKHVKIVSFVSVADLEMTTNFNLANNCCYKMFSACHIREKMEGSTGALPL